MGIHSNNGVCCKRDKNGVRQHAMVRVLDKELRPWDSCEKCGYVLVQLEKRSQKSTIRA